MKSQFVIALKSFVLLTLITGVLYPLALTALSEVLLASRAEGSLLSAQGELVAAGEAATATGSVLLGQGFDQPGEFWGRLSQTAENPYNAMASGASNLGTSNPALADNARARLEALGPVTGPIPVDLLTSSGSGLDPHISVAAARIQVPRVAQATGKSPQDLEALIARVTEPPTLGVLGQARVNVVLLNLELKKL
jgi:K+-transporting ATPase ATPase C chain